MRSIAANILCLLLAASLAKGVVGQKCTPCEGDVDPNLSFDGVPCDYWVTVAGHNPAGSAQCTFDRMVGVWFCGCPVPEDTKESCTLCGDGSQDFNQMKTFPDSVITCDDISEVPAIDGQQTCRELNQMAGYCECPRAESESDEKCSICPNGAAPATPDRVFLTTGESCQQIIDTLDMAPTSDCGKYVPNTMIDYQSYCGCPEQEPPSQCSLCPEGTHLADPDHPIAYVPNSTCADFDAYTKYITEPQLCDYMHEVISMECCEGMDPALTNYTTEEDGCSFCPGGREVLLPERPLIGTDMTCGEVAAREDDGTCGDRFKTQFDMLMDTQVYCVCPGSKKTEACDFCPPGQELLYPDSIIENGVTPANATCEQYAAMADATSDSTFCSAVQNIGALNSCCGYREPDHVEGMCSLCDSGAAVQQKDRLFLGTSVTCQNYQDEMRRVPLGETCDAVFSDFESTFDPQIYCGCPTTQETGLCNLCPDGSEVVDPNTWISDIFTTCGQMEHIAAATSNQEFCSSIQRVGQYYCCFSPGSGGGGGKRQLRSSEDEKEPATTTEDSVSPFHFAAIKAIDLVQKKVANLVNREFQAIQVEPEEHQTEDEG